MCPINPVLNVQREHNKGVTAFSRGEQPIMTMKMGHLLFNIQEEMFALLHYSYIITWVGSLALALVSIMRIQTQLEHFISLFWQNAYMLLHHMRVYKTYTLQEILSFII